MGKLIFVLLTIIAGLAWRVAVICCIGGIIAALIAYFTAGVISIPVGSCVAFAVWSGIIAAISLLCYIGFVVGAASRG